MRCPECEIGKLRPWPFQPELGWRVLYGCAWPGRGEWATYDTGCGWTGTKKEARAERRARRKAGVLV